MNVWFVTKPVGIGAVIGLSESAGMSPVTIGTSPPSNLTRIVAIGLSAQVRGPIYHGIYSRVTE